MTAEIIEFIPRPQPPKEAVDAMIEAQRLLAQANGLIALADRLCVQAGVEPPGKKAHAPRRV
jgi:hypothetical protein